MCMALGGRVAEAIIFNKVTTGTPVPLYLRSFIVDYNLIYKSCIAYIFGVLFINFFIDLMHMT